MKNLEQLNDVNNNIDKQSKLIKSLKDDVRRKSNFLLESLKDLGERNPELSNLEGSKNSQLEVIGLETFFIRCYCILFQ